jgi:hypothetical protein
MVILLDILSFSSMLLYELTGNYSHASPRLASSTGMCYAYSWVSLRARLALSKEYQIIPESPTSCTASLDSVPD